MSEALAVAHLADACLAVGAPLRVAPPLLPNLAGVRLSGRARPVRHYGSVDIFLEALERSAPGEVLVIDNQGRDDEGCVGDLIGLEALRAGIAGLVIWGRHRDSAELRAIGLPVFSRGACARGPVRTDARDSDPFAAAVIGAERVTGDDWVAADEDGIIFIGDEVRDATFAAARTIRDKETAQSQRMRAGTSLREQLDFGRYLEARAADPALTFRAHLQRIGGAVEA